MAKHEKLGDGNRYCVIEGPSLSDYTQAANYAIPEDFVGQLHTRGETDRLAQYVSIIEPDLISAKHLFRGLDRRLFDDNSPNADRDKFALSWKPSSDYIFNVGDSVQVAPEPDHVFVVIVTKNVKHQHMCPHIEGWIDWWSWVAETDGPLKEAPIDWLDRYDERVWSKPSGPSLTVV